MPARLDAGAPAVTELEIEFSARLVLCEWLLESLHAMAFLVEPDPLAACHAAKRHALTLLEHPHGWPIGDDLEAQAGIMRGLRHLTPRHFDRVRAALERELGRTGAAGIAANDRKET